jgi:transcriptional regulator with XRE-family HTH domain
MAVAAVDVSPRVTSLAPWSVDVAEIDRARILHGWTRRDLSLKAHIDEGTLCDLFSGRRRPTFGTLRALCVALDLSFQSVICFQGPEANRRLHNVGLEGSDVG